MLSLACGAALAHPWRFCFCTSGMNLFSVTRRSSSRSLARSACILPLPSTTLQSLEVLNLSNVPWSIYKPRSDVITLQHLEKDGYFRRNMAVRSRFHNKEVLGLLFPEARPT